MDKMQEFISLFKEGNGSKAFDLLATDYYLLTKDELANIAKELIYAIHSYGMNGNFEEKECKQMFQNVAEELGYYYE